MDGDERRIVSFTATSHGLVHTYELSIPILLTVWTVEFSTTAAVLGFVVAVGYGLFGIGALPGGILVDRYGSKSMILACLLGMAGSFLLASLSPNLITLGVAVAIWGIAASVYHPAGLALLSNAVERRGTALGYHGIGGNVGIALGPLATVLLLIPFDWRLVAALLAVPALIAAAYGLTVDVDGALASAHDATPNGGENGTPNGEEGGGTTGEVSLSSVVTDTRTLLTVGFALVLVFVTFSGLYYRAFLTFLPDLLGDAIAGLVEFQFVDPDSPYADEFDPARYLYVAILMMGVFGQFIGGRIADRIAPERGLIYAMGVLALLAVSFVPATATAATFLAVSLLLGVALFLVQPLSQSTVAAYSPPESRGLSFGFTYLAIFGVGSLGAGLAGTILTVAGPSELFLVLAATAAIAAITAVAIGRFGTRRE